MDWEKFLEEIELDLVEEPHKPSKFHTAQKAEDSSLAYVHMHAFTCICAGYNLLLENCVATTATQSSTCVYSSCSFLFSIVARQEFIIINIANK